MAAALCKGTTGQQGTALDLTTFGTLWWRNVPGQQNLAVAACVGRHNRNTVAQGRERAVFCAFDRIEVVSLLNSSSISARMFHSDAHSAVQCTSLLLGRLVVWVPLWLPLRRLHVRHGLHAACVRSLSLIHPRGRPLAAARLSVGTAAVRRAVTPDSATEPVAAPGRSLVVAVCPMRWVETLQRAFSTAGRAAAPMTTTAVIAATATACQRDAQPRLSSGRRARSGT